MTAVDDGARVLVIEDELRVAQFVSSGLRMDGYEVVVAEDGDVGVFLATTESFDLFVLDLGLASASGLETLERIRHAQDAPVIVLSERDDPEARRVWQVAGASEFIPKPLVVESLRAKVKEQLARRHS